MKILIQMVLMLVVLTSPLFAQTYNLDNKDKFKIKAKVNEEITFTVKTNLTTGYDWEINIDSTNNTIQIIAEDYENYPDTPEGIVGAPIQKIYKIKALEKGQYTIKLAYRRSWEKNVPINEKTIKLKIKA